MDGDHGPKLWCGMANGKLQVFDASTWMLEQPCLQAKDRIVRSAYVSFNILFNAKRRKKSKYWRNYCGNYLFGKAILKRLCLCYENGLKQNLVVNVVRNVVKVSQNDLKYTLLMTLTTINDFVNNINDQISWDFLIFWPTMWCFFYERHYS